jgi:hypothetical protein
MQRRDKSKKDAQGLKGQHHDIFYPRFYFTSQPYMVLWSTTLNRLDFSLKFAKLSNLIFDMSLYIRYSGKSQFFIYFSGRTDFN